MRVSDGDDMDSTAARRDRGRSATAWPRESSLMKALRSGNYPGRVMQESLPLNGHVNVNAKTEVKPLAFGAAAGA
jgi:hypothetical protein